MASHIFEIELPNGEILEIEAPEDTAPDVIKNKAKQYLANQSMQPKAAPPSGIDVASWFTGKKSTKGLFEMIAERSKGGPVSATLKTPDQVSAFQHHVMNLPYGLSQSGMNAASYGADKLLGNNSGIATTMRNDANGFKSELAQREKDYQSTTPDSFASYAGATAGEVLPWLVGAPEKALSSLTAKIAPKGSGIARRVVAGGAAGAAMSAAAPVTGPGNYGDQKAAQAGIGALTGGAIPLVTSGLGGAYSGGKELFNMVFRPESVAAKNLARIYKATPETVDKLRNAPQYVPGETVTAAQALQTPEAVMAEKAMRNRPEFKAAFTEADNANNQARMGVVEKYAGNDAEMNAAISKRRQDAEPFTRGVLNDPSKTVSAGDVVKKLEELKKSGNPVVSAAAKQHLKVIADNADASGNVPVAALDDIRQNIGAMLAKHAPNGVVSSVESAKYGPVSAKIISTLERQIPGYSDYLRAYRANSQPINTMEAGRSILGPISNRRLNSGGDQTLTLNDLAQGFKRDNKSRYSMSPDAKQALTGVQDSLKRRSISDSISSPGSDTAYNLQADSWLAKNLLGESLGGPTKTGYVTTGLLGAALGNVAAPGLLGTGGGAFLASGLKKAAYSINAKISNKVGEGAINSKKAADMIEKFLKENPQDRQKLLEKYPHWVQLIGNQSPKAIQQQ